MTIKAAAPEVSVVIPLRDEEKHIDHCLESLFAQDFPAERLEVLLVDGMSADGTRGRVAAWQTRYPGIRLLDNPGRTAPRAMNIGIRAARGRYIVRLDAHSSYAPDYISKCLLYLEKTGADNVGGVIETRGKGFWGTAIALMLSSRFGVGNASFRVGAADGYADTVPFGAFRREAFERYGYYDERLTRNQDYELNYRIRRQGGKIYLANEIKLTYYSRSSVRAIAGNAFGNGKWNIITSFLCPGSMSARHYAPLAFVLSLLLLPPAAVFISPVFRYALTAELALYLLLALGFSAAAARRPLPHGHPAPPPAYFAALLFLFPLFHISYGCGSVAGLGWRVSRKSAL
ncbi:MAG: glycosyltransferase family 2 protein [Gracilibacteraceae bacterium]|jgi:glycosyltransferase involved in cell wall biosynthesis|nr:glycosyltransferase family 2 protein [Gracilibacteraceae bacterium]